MKMCANRHADLHIVDMCLCVPVCMLWIVVKMCANRHAVECSEGVCQSACCGV